MDGGPGDERVSHSVAIEAAQEAKEVYHEPPVAERHEELRVERASRDMPPMTESIWDSVEFGNGSDDLG